MRLIHLVSFTEIWDHPPKDVGEGCEKRNRGEPTLRLVCLWLRKLFDKNMYDQSPSGLKERDASIQQSETCSLCAGGAGGRQPDWAMQRAIHTVWVSYNIIPLDEHNLTLWGAESLFTVEVWTNSVNFRAARFCHMTRLAFGPKYRIRETRSVLQYLLKNHREQQWDKQAKRDAAQTWTEIQTEVTRTRGAGGGNSSW